MRKFRTTAAIFVVGVLASKVMTGLESPLYNQWEGEVRVKDMFFGPKPGISINFEIINHYPSWDRRIVEFEFSGDQTKLAELGIPNKKVSCEISKSAVENRAGKWVYFELSGDESICTELRMYNEIAQPTGIEFQGKRQILYAQVERNNSRGFIVGLMQYVRLNDWIRTRTGDV